MPFSTDYDYVRNSGKTRINSAGLVVGVDFSSSTTTIGTGTQIFTLSADAGVNRSWTAGEPVLIQDLVGVGTMTGTVNSYVPSTQSLSINVTSVTGSGTSSSWRIGSRALVRDSRTGAINVEPAATNLLTFSEEFDNAAWSKVANGTGTAPVVTANFAVSPSGSQDADRVVFALNGGTTTNDRSDLQTATAYTATAGVTYVVSMWIKSNTGSNVAMRLEPASGVNTLATGRQGFNTSEITVTPQWQRFAVAYSASSTGNANVFLRLRGASNTADSADVSVWGAQFELNELTSYIPTKAATQSRVADSVSLTTANNNKLNPTSGSLIADVVAPGFGTSQKRLFRLDSTGGDVRLVKRGVHTLGTLGRGLEIGNDIFIPVTQGQLGRCNGIEMTAVTFANDDRTNTSYVAESSSVMAYDGSNTVITNMGVPGGLSFEVLFNKNLSTISYKGMGNNGLNGAHWTGSTFLMAPSVSAQRVFRSSDGLSYSRVNTPVLAQTLNEFANMTVAAVNRVVAVGTAGFIATSDDEGLTWTSRTSGTTNNITGVTAGLGLYVACVLQGATNIRTSPDGITWTQRTTAAGASQRDVAFNGTNLFASVGDTGTIQTSPDGITWTARTSGTTQQLLGITFGNGQWVAVGANGTILTSPNGTTWTSRTSGTTQNLNEVIYFAAGSVYIAVGANTTLLTSLDGITWTTRTVPTSASTAINGVAVNGTIAIATGANGYFISSLDGVTWTPQSNIGATIGGMAFGSGVFVSTGNASGGSGYIATINPTTGVVKRVAQGLTTGSIGNCRFVNGLFYAMSATTNGLFFTSTDGENWTSRTIASASALPVDIAYDPVNGKYVISLTAGRMASSTDGINFTGYSLGVSVFSMLSVIFSNSLKKFIAAGTSGNIVISDTGDSGTWTLVRSVADAVSTTSQINNLFESTRDGVIYATGGSGGASNTQQYLYSEDGVTWNNVNGAGFVSIQNASGLQTSKYLGAWKTGRNRLAVSYENNNVVMAMNGVVRSDLTVTLPNFTAARLGYLAENLDGEVYEFRAFDKTLTSTELAAMTLVF